MERDCYCSESGTMVIGSSAPKTDRSAELTNYPTDLLNSPPQDLSATIQFRFPAMPAPHAHAKRVALSKSRRRARRCATVAPAGESAATPRNAFTELITTRRLSLWFLITAAFIAFGLGALHALEPGHGKTIVAAYLVGSRGTARHALLLGVIVTASHTAGVLPWARLLSTPRVTSFPSSCTRGWVSSPA